MHIESLHHVRIPVKEPRYAISYAEWVALELDRAEIRVYNRDDTLAESRVVGRSLQEMRVGA